MEIKKISKILPGEEIKYDGKPGIGIYNNKATIFGDLITINENSKVENNTFVFINSKSNLYIPQIDDIVIGKIIHKTMDFYKVDLGQSNIAFLPGLNFPNVTKRNKPDLKIGEYISGKIIKKGEECVLYCSEGLGKICDNVFSIPVWKVRKLIIGDYLSQLGEKYKFEIGLGMNGKIFINCEDPITISMILKELDLLN